MRGRQSTRRKWRGVRVSCTGSPQCGGVNRDGGKHERYATTCAMVVGEPTTPWFYAAPLEHGILGETNTDHLTQDVRVSPQPSNTAVWS